MEEKSKISIKQIFYQYWKGLDGYKTLFFFSIFFFIITNIVEVIIPYFYKNFFNILTSNFEKTDIIVSSLVSILILIVGMHFFSWVFSRLGFVFSNHAEARVAANLKQNSFNYLIRHSYSFFANSFSGGLVQKVNRQARAFEKLYDTLVFTFIPLIITVAGSIIITYFTSKLLALIILVWVIVYAISSFIFYWWRMKYDIKVAAADSETTAMLSDNISNNQSILLFNGYHQEMDSFKGATVAQANITVKSWDFVVIYDSVQLFIIYILEFLVFFFAIRLWQVDILTVGGIVMVQFYAISLGRQIWSVNNILRNVFEGLADSKEMTEIMLTPHEVIDINSAQDFKIEKGEIDFKYVTFNFNETRDVLTNINCKIQAGEKVALIGPSGAGKTTFIRLLLRLYNLTNGEILIDSQNISNITQESLRENISLVPQDPVLFHRSLMENIRYGKPEATDEEVFQASKLAYCDDFIDSLPNKYDTLVGERGIKLSGGERQRIAIARAILKSAPILILDEATSSLDSNSEKLIQDALDNLMKDCTTIVIAHRLSTIRKMDRILVMSDGKIIEEGNHADLINKDSGLYKDLWELQAGGFIQK